MKPSGTRAFSFFVERKVAWRSGEVQEHVMIGVGFLEQKHWSCGCVGKNVCYLGYHLSESEAGWRVVYK